MDRYVLHGYTMKEVDRLATLAAFGLRSLGAEFGEAKDEARSAILLALAEADSQPTKDDLLHAAGRAVRRQDRAFWGGKATDDTKAKYWSGIWLTLSQQGPSPEGVDTRLTLEKVLSQLHEDDAKILVLYGSCLNANGGEYGAMVRLTELLGCSERTAQRKLRRAQNAALAWWYDGEEVPPRYEGTRRLNEWRTAHRCEEQRRWDRYADSRKAVA